MGLNNYLELIMGLNNYLELIMIIGSNKMQLIMCGGMWC